MGGQAFGREGRFAGAVSLVRKQGLRRSVTVSSRRRMVSIDLQAEGESILDADALLATLEKVMTKTFTLKP